MEESVDTLVATAVRDPLRVSHDVIRASLIAEARNQMNLSAEEIEALRYDSSFLSTRVLAALHEKGVARDALLQAHTKVVSHFEKILFHPHEGSNSLPTQEGRQGLRMVPSINRKYSGGALPVKPSGALVRFRCMVQDIFDPEIFLAIFGVNDKMVGLGHYLDSLPEAVNDVDIGAETSLTYDRLPLYCIEVPGESGWVKQGWEARSNPIPLHEAPHPEHAPTKRRRVEEELQQEDNMETTAIEKENTMEEEASTKETKRVKWNLEKEATSQTTDDIQPTIHEWNHACIVKTYDISDEEKPESSVKLNDIIEFVGVLSAEPSIDRSSEQEDSYGMDFGDFDERRGREPPATLVPRLHAISMKKIHFNNPLFASHLDYLKPNSPEFERFCGEIMPNADSLRGHAIEYLASALGGDKLAAEYLFLCLLSRVHNRQGPIPIGKMVLNIVGCPASVPHPSTSELKNAPKNLNASGFGQILHEAVSSIASLSTIIPLSIDNLNKSSFAPKKDYALNRLSPNGAQLQLPSGTVVLLDEVALRPGQLKSIGVKNLSALSDLLQWQRVDYDFQYHKMEFSVDYPSVVLSDGNSLLKNTKLTASAVDGIESDWFIVPLLSSLTEKNVTYEIPAVRAPLTADWFYENIRKFMALARHIEPSMDDNLSERVATDFATLRKTDPTVNEFTLHRWLNLARLVTISFGQTRITTAMWDYARNLETQRSERLREWNKLRPNKSQTQDQNIYSVPVSM
eukprot:TRINITY_DN4234_c0_g1_i1.p1 TRINITY_DN4234_c0_g1~~TRINITY_DN4234_c0_g1_i1.p1  ORF type:complete len:742 (-),score=143.21 TRINITY_DN4234_c0_g1_i1:942-3167(-)